MPLLFHFIFILYYCLHFIPFYFYFCIILCFHYFIYFKKKGKKQNAWEKGFLLEKLRVENDAWEISRMHGKRSFFWKKKKGKTGVFRVGGGKWS